MKQVLSATHTLVNVLRHHREQPVRMEGDDAKERWAVIVNKLNELVAPVAAEVEALFNNPRLTDAGKMEAALKIGPRVVGNFAIVGRVVHEADQAIGRLEQLIFGPLTDKPKGDATVTFLREAEIRQSIPKGQNGIAFLEAINAENLEVARAILDRPAGHGISDEILRRGREAFALKTAPEIWRNLEHVNVLREALNALASQVAQWLILLGASERTVRQSTGANVAQPFQVKLLSEYLEQTAAAKK